ncbi:hypothetical protein [Rhizomonospora bruguierae]|uniref:hypothetical protein n=1 Tax=Rhizomonospora bruguierae TaxID=1581705 RepID=UPI001BD03C52|nr:hypothetical protein [Micromonospora sp. NBRC 107566]
MTQVLPVRAASAPPDFHHQVTAAFEATMLMRCAQPGTGRGGPTRAPQVHRPAGVLVEFSRHEAADRLVALLHRLGCPATPRVARTGIREQRPIYQISLAPDDQAALVPVLHDSWRTGLALLSDPPGRYLAPRRRRHRDDLAAAAWRAAVLAAGSQRRQGKRGFYIADNDTMAVLVRAGRVLHLTVTAQRRAGCHLVRIGEPEPAGRAASLR